MALFKQTHSIDYRPENMGRDWVEARCGEGVHITSYSAEPQCRECRIILLRERLQNARKITTIKTIFENAEKALIQQQDEFMEKVFKGEV